MYGEPTDVPNSPQTSATIPFTPAVGGSQATVITPSITTAQSVPHRAWEEGYQSPFAQTSPSSIQAAPFPPSGLPASSPAVETPTIRHPEGTSHRRGPYQPRSRKVTTKEITLSEIDVSAMLDLGLSPFKENEDMIANQNRFVRNECIIARKFQELRRAQASADGRHSDTESNIYAHLEKHSAYLDKLINGPGSATVDPCRPVVRPARTDSDFAALERAHQETCARLEALERQVGEYLRSTKLALADLAQRLERIAPGSPTTTTSISPLLLSTSTSSLKRKWDSSADSILESPSTMPPPTPDFDNYRLPRTQ